LLPARFPGSKNSLLVKSDREVSPDFGVVTGQAEPLLETPCSQVSGVTQQICRKIAFLGNDAPGPPFVS
jgi:hypothetical protein